MAEVRRGWRVSGATLGLAIAGGVILAAATLLEPVRAWHRALTRPAITGALLSADATERSEAWRQLEAALGDANTRADTLAEVDAMLAQALREGEPPDEAVAELAMRIDRFFPWQWERPVDREVLVRSIGFAARRAEGSANPALLAFAAERLLELPPSVAFPLAPQDAASLWSRLDAPMQARLLPGLASLPPSLRHETLSPLDMPADPRTAGLLLLARLASSEDLEAASRLTHDSSAPAPLRDRAAAAMVRLDSLAAIGLLAPLEVDPSAPWATILAPASTEPAVRAAFEARAAEGDAASRRLLARIDAVADGESPEAEALAAAWDLLSDPASPADARRLSALVLVVPPREELPESALANLLDGPLADEDGSVLATALLAQATGQTRRAATWLRSLEDDRKRAGAMLAVIADGPRGADAAALARTQEAASDPSVRSLLRTASWSLASPRDFGARDADREFVHRVSHQVSARGDRGELDLDVLALRLAAGDPAAVEALLAMSEEPANDRPEAIRRWSTRRSLRWLLVERFVPTLAATLGPPLGGSRRERSLQADLALVEWWSQRHRLRFDPSTRQWVERPGAVSNARPNATSIARRERLADL